MFEKVEKLRERANVTYEEAKEALESCNGDLLDAMVYLEKNGRVKQPNQTSYSTSYEEQEKFTSVQETVKKQQAPENVFQALRRTTRTFIDKCKGNYFCITKNNEVKVKIPVLLFIVLAIAFWKLVIPAMIILLFFGCRYSFFGKDELAQANEMINKASDIAEQLVKGFTDSIKDRSQTSQQTSSNAASQTTSSDAVNDETADVNEMNV